MLILVVQIGRFDSAPEVSILCKYNHRPDTVHFNAAKTVMRISELSSIAASFTGD
jgi:hypothetical protein